jgi:hypothetical protein
MTIIDLVVLGASALVVALIVGLAALLGFRKGVLLDSAEAVRARVLEFEPDAIVRDAVIDSGAKAAAALLADGRIALVRAVADGVGVRIAPAAALSAVLAGGVLRVRIGDLGFPDVCLRLAAPPDWLARLVR